MACGLLQAPVCHLSRRHSRRAASTPVLLNKATRKLRGNVILTELSVSYLGSLNRICSFAETPNNSSATLGQRLHDCVGLCFHTCMMAQPAAKVKGQ